MKKSNSRMIHTTSPELNAPRKVARIPSVAGKMFRLTSESAGSIH